MTERLFSRIFRVAAGYNIIAGLITIADPQLFFRFFGLPEINHPYVMRGLGMFVGVYGYGFYLVSTDLRRHHQFAVVGLIGKSFGVAGWIYYSLSGEIPWNAYWINILNDLVWIPVIILYLRWLHRTAPGTGRL
ncbi:MAG: alkyl hydroperoxide reductase [Bacteroidetes bacterium]|nr:alkyl hydroperoxide reductase [Bacteroidota bacterium]